MLLHPTVSANWLWSGSFLLSQDGGRGPYLSDLNTPVEQGLRADVVLVRPDVVEQAAVGHELGHQLHVGGQADAQQAAYVGVFHAGHHVGLLKAQKRSRMRICSMLESRFNPFYWHTAVQINRI